MVVLQDRRQASMIKGRLDSNGIKARPRSGIKDCLRSSGARALLLPALLQVSLEVHSLANTAHQLRLRWAMCQDSNRTRTCPKPRTISVPQ